MKPSTLIVSVLLIAVLSSVGTYLYINSQKQTTNIIQQQEDDLSATIAPENQTSQLSTTPAVTSISEKTFKGRSIYAQEANIGYFTLTYPDICREESTINSGHNQIVCTYKGSTFKIYSAGGRGADVIKKDTVTLNNITWDRVTFNQDESIGRSYNASINGLAYLIEIDFDSAAPELQTEAEKIIATFKTF